MLSLPEASPRTRSLWGFHQRHAIRIEVVILGLTIFSLIFAFAQIAEMHTHLSVPGMPILDLPAPLLSLVSSAGAVFAFARRSLHPVYSLIVAILFFFFWVTTLYFDIEHDLTSMWDLDDIGQQFHEQVTPVGVMVCKNILYGAVTVSYLVYIGIAARAVDNNRKRKPQGIPDLHNGMDFELFKKPGPNNNMKRDRQGKLELHDEMDAELVKNAGPASTWHKD